MVFTKLSVHEKDAFFGLLDEYFQSRPELFGQNGNGRGMSAVGGTGTVSTAAAASVVQRAFATAGGNTAGSTSGVASSASGKSNNPYAVNMPNNADVARAVAVGRVAAASLAFSGGGLPSQSQPQPQSQTIQHGAKLGDPPPTLPRRTTSDVLGSTSFERVVSPGSEVDKLVTKKASVFSAFKKPETAGVTIPPAFVAPKSTFGPPPTRRAISETSTGSATGGGGAVGTHAQRQAPPESASSEGEWAEALYDYNSEDPGDLTIGAGMRVFVTDKSSEDWWTGQVEGQGRQGLFPASYVKLL